MNTSLLDAAQAFVARYHANARLCADQAGWDCGILLQPGEAAAGVFLDVRDGRVTAVSAQAGPAPQLVVHAPLQILLDILQLKLNPNQPYLFGELTVHGAEADFMRVDYVATMLCAP